jgi:hypothetical protein
MENNFEQFLTIKELAARWRKCIYTIYRWKDSKPDFPAQFRQGEKGIVFDIQDVIRYEKRIKAKKSKNKQK